MATALGILLERAGHRVVGASGRERTIERVRNHLPGVPVLPSDEAAALAEVVILGVPDDLVEETSRALARQGAFREDQLVTHLSGALGLSALAEARAAGAGVLSLHPLQSFPSVEEGVRRLPGSAVAVTALTPRELSAGESLTKDVGGVPFAVADEVKPVYHAAAVFCSNYVVAVMGTAQRLFQLAGIRDPQALFAPLARAALEAALAEGAASALTGPAVRGDAGTLTRHLEALAVAAPDVVEPYVALARVSIAVAARAGRLDAGARARLEEALARWR